MSDAACLTPEQGLLELTLLNAEMGSDAFDDVVVEGIKRKIPTEILSRLHALWDVTKTIAGELVAVGKIIVKEIFSFLKANPKLTVGMALGAAVAALAGGIPFIGSLLEPLTNLLFITYGGGVGAAIEKGDVSGDPFSAVAHLAQEFFTLLANIFNAIVAYWA